MATKKKGKGFTLEVDGEVLGTFESIKPLDKTNWPEKYTDFVRKFPSCNQGSPGMHQISFPVGSFPEFFGPSPECSGKTTLGLSLLAKLLRPGHLYVRAQLEMWGVEKTKEVCADCLEELARTLEDMGYRVWFDEKSSINEDLAAAHGVVVYDYKLSYVGVGEKDE
jgi:hypothetical protein